MKTSEASAILTLASSFDRRTVGEADAQAWAAALPDVRFEDARAAVVAHFRESSEWLDPARLGKLVRTIRANRLDAIEHPIPPRELADHPTAERAWVRTFQHAICDGSTREAAIWEANAAFNIPPEDEPPPGIEMSTELREQVRAQLVETAQKLARDKSLAKREMVANRERRKAERAKRAESIAALEGEAIA